MNEIATPLHLSNGEDYFDLRLAAEEEADSLPRSDAYVICGVRSRGFGGANDLWVDGRVLESFCRALVALRDTLRGEAVLESISPGEMKLALQSVNSRGTLAVNGQLGYEAGDREASFFHSVSFGFTFEPWQLDCALGLPWVRRYAQLAH